MRINVPPLTRVLLVVLACFTLLNSLLAENPTPLSLFTRIGHGWRYLSLVPRQWYYAPWTFLTAAAVEQNIFGLLVTGVALLFGGRYLERAWGLPEFAKFMLIVCMIPNILVWAVYEILWALSGSNAAA
jgi:membrane associated rhomboid family serine protease